MVRGELSDLERGMDQMIKMLVEVTLHLDNPREVNLDRVIMKAMDHAIEGNIDGYDGVDVTWSDVKITWGEG